MALHNQTNRLQHIMLSNIMTLEQLESLAPLLAHP